MSDRFSIANTFSLPASAAAGCLASSVEDVQEAQRTAKALELPIVCVGHGSNLIPAPAVRAFVCQMSIMGVELLAQDDLAVRIRVGAGEDWHTLVMSCTQNGWFGLENLALIPGTVGAAPIQNIGAYGAEVAGFVEHVHVLDADGEMRSFANQDCGFAYRKSLFQERTDLVVTHVDLKLTTAANPVLDYPDLQDWARSLGRAPEPLEVANKVIAIRSAKLPDPKLTPNAGSFFKNPVIDGAQASDLASQHGLKCFPVEGIERSAKLSAAQLLDMAGWKLKGNNRVGCWQKQPLVLVNEGGAVYDDVFSFASEIQADIADRFGVQLEIEPQLIKD